MFDAHGNKILAEVNGWKITRGEFCYCLSKSGKVLHHKGSLDGAKALAERSA
jgi:hypothetical protein